jgi:hypothetical protein
MQLQPALAMLSFGPSLLTAKCRRSSVIKAGCSTGMGLWWRGCSPSPLRYSPPPLALTNCSGRKGEFCARASQTMKYLHAALLMLLVLAAVAGDASPRIAYQGHIGGASQALQARAAAGASCRGGCSSAARRHFMAGVERLSEERQCPRMARGRAGIAWLPAVGGKETGAARRHVVGIPEAAAEHGIVHM